MQTLAGEGFAKVVRAGTHAVLRSQETLDRINVFPVADADTGANLVATLTAATSALGDGSPAAIGSAARLVADAALAGARGNSGAIFAQFLDGLAGGLESKTEVGTREFARAATAGADAAYLAVLHPREGTILTVLRAWALEMTLRASHLHDFRELLDRALSAARTALAGTPGSTGGLASQQGGRRRRPGSGLFPRGLDGDLGGRDDGCPPRRGRIAAARCV